MGKIASSGVRFRAGAWYIVPAAILGAIAFYGVSSAELNYFVSGYLVLLLAQLGVVGVYLLINRLKASQSKNRKM